MKKGGMHFGTDPDGTYQAIKAIRESTSLTVITKLTPNVTDITEFARAAVSAGTDAFLSSMHHSRWLLTLKPENPNWVRMSRAG